MAGLPELIKNFGSIRDYLRDFLVYGFKMRNDYREEKRRSYDDMKHRAECWLGDFVSCDDSVRGRRVSIMVDSGHITENPLYQAYRAKSFTKNDIRLHFFLTDLLTGSAEPMSLAEICDGMSEKYGAAFDTQTVRNKLREYSAEGIVEARRCGNSMMYSFTGDTVSSFTDELPGLPDALAFFSEVPGFGVVGNTMLRAAGMKNTVFLVKHNYIVHALEEEVLLELISAIKNGQAVEAKVTGTYRRAKQSEPAEVKLVPLQIACSVQTGRRFLTAYDTENGRFSSYRLDFICEVGAPVFCKEYDEICAEYRKRLDRCFGVSFNCPETDVTPLVMTIAVGEDEDFILRRLEREQRCGTLEKAGDGLYRLTFDVDDPIEIMHWAKTLIGRTVSIEGGARSIRETYRDDIERMYRMYGGDGDDSVQ